jgi:hypothetical protein
MKNNHQVACWLLSFEWKAKASSFTALPLLEARLCLEPVVTQGGGLVNLELVGFYVLDPNIQS